MRVRPIGRYIQRLIVRAPITGWFKKRGFECLGHDNRGEQTVFIPWDGQLFYGPISGVGSQVTRTIYERGVYEPEATRAFVELVKSGTVVVDVGAQFGYYTLMAAKRVGRGGKVLTFEPKTWVRHILSANVHINFYDNVEIFPYALFSRSERLNLIEHQSRILTNGDELRERTEEVQAVVFDEIIGSIDSMRDRPIDLIKIDVEGAEFDALKGMTRSILRWKPVLLIEIHPPKLTYFGYTCSDLLQLIESWNYEFEPLNVDDSVVSKAIYGEHAGPINAVCKHVG
jgi:FkbM family methyltransferase